jgi:hypothetical protein
MSDYYPVPTTTEEYEKMYGKFVDPADKDLEGLTDSDLDPDLAREINPSIVKEISHEVNIETDETDEDDDSSEEARDTDDLLEDWEQHDYHQLTGDWS